MDNRAEIIDNLARYITNLRHYLKINKNTPDERNLTFNAGKLHGYEIALEMLGWEVDENGNLRKRS